jgi:hypothetical protein
VNNTCVFRTDDCSLSRPCAKCRDASSHAAHGVIRFGAHGFKGGRYIKEEPVSYQRHRGGYWHARAA